MMIDPHTAETSLQPAVVQVDAHPLGQHDVDDVRPVLESGLSQRRRGHDDPHDAHQPVGRKSPGRGDLGGVVHRHIGPAQRLEMADVGWLTGQFDGGHTDGFVDQRKRDGVLGREVPAEGAGRDVGDRGDLVDGGAVESLPLAQLDSRVDQRRAGPLLLAFPQAEGWLPPDISHDRMLTRQTMNEL